jgi:2-desacetyl-2-hydroxyethyl bacteriochlorophyllide A dehydrogenase
MKSVLIEIPGKVKLIESKKPLLLDDEVLLEIQYIGLCGSDLSSFRGRSPLVVYPVIPGHEVSGIIVDKGKTVPEIFNIGDSVTVNPYSSCGKCPACRSGRMNCCEFNHTLGVQRHGAMSEFFAIHYNKVLKNNNLSATELALVEPLSVGYHATNRGNVSCMDTVLVIGCGMIGMGAILACVKKGATVIAVDIDDKKLELVKMLGATYVVNSAKTDTKKRLYEITSGEGVSVCIEAVGSPLTYKMAVEAVAFAGRVVFIGYTNEEVAFNTSLFVKKELTICGSRNALFEFEPVIKMLEDKTIPAEKLITKVYPIEQTEIAFADWDNKPADFIKILIQIK